MSYHLHLLLGPDQHTSSSDLSLLFLPAGAHTPSRQRSIDGACYSDSNSLSLVPRSSQPIDQGSSIRRWCARNKWFDSKSEVGVRICVKGMRDLISSCESGGLGSETRRHVSNFSRSIARLSYGKPASWSTAAVHHNQLHICKPQGLKWQKAAATVVSSSTMQRYTSTSMSSFDDAAGGYFQESNNNNNSSSFGMESGEQAVDEHGGRNNSFASLDPSAGFPGLGELPSGGMQPESAGVENNLSGTFTGDLNASAYDHVVVTGEDHTQLLHDMLQQQQSSSHTNHHSGQSTQPSQGGASASAWEDSLHVLQEMLLLQQQQQAQQIYQSQAEQVFSHAYPSTTTHDRGYTNKTPTLFSGESELLSLLQLPRSASVPVGSHHRGKGPIYSTSTMAGPVNTGDYFESRLGLSHHAATQSAASFFHSLPGGGNHTSSLLSRPAPILLDLDQDRDIGDDGKGASTSPFGHLKRDHGSTAVVGALGKQGEPRGVNHFATERQRREFLNEKYQTLRSLVPNPTKADRASIVADAIEYVKELKREVQDLQLMVQEKRRVSGSLTGRKRSHRSMELAAGDGSAGLPGTDSMTDSASTFIQRANEHAFTVDGTHLRTSWLQRTSQNGTQVDVRIVHDEVTIKLTQRRRKNCLLDVCGVLQELHLDLLQASGASIGEHDVYLFNTKILDGSSTFARYIADKMLEAVDHRPLM